MSFKWYLSNAIGLIEAVGQILRLSANLLYYLWTLQSLERNTTMAVKTYQIGLYLTLKTAHRYIARWQPKLQASMTTEQYTCLVAVLDAIVECLPLITPAIPSP